MIYRSNINLGCLAAVFTFLTIFLIFRFSWIIIFKIPVGLILFAYLVYRFISKRYRLNKVKKESFKSEDQTVPASDEIEVDYEEYD